MGYKWLLSQKQQVKVDLFGYRRDEDLRLDGRFEDKHIKRFLKTLK